MTVHITSDTGPCAIFPVWVLRHDLDEAELRLYLSLRSFADAGSGNAYPHRQTVADRAGVSIATYKRALIKLEARGLVTKTARSTAHRGFIGWTYHIPVVPPFPQVTTGGSPGEPPVPENSDLTNTGGSCCEPGPGSPGEPPKDSFEFLEQTTEQTINKKHCDAVASNTGDAVNNTSTAPVEDPRVKTSETVPSGPGAPPDFEAFWKIYPKAGRKAKGAARKAWDRAVKSVSPATIMNATPAELTRHVV